MNPMTDMPQNMGGPNTQTSAAKVDPDVGDLATAARGKQLDRLVHQGGEQSQSSSAEQAV